MTHHNPKSRAARRKQKHGHQDEESTKKAHFTQESRHTGLLVTEEFDKAVAECKARVKTIAQNCRLRNRKFRDIEFDLEMDRERCLYGSGKPGSPEYFDPIDVLRVTQLFDKPAFYIDGVDSNDIQQGKLGDCWFLSALATLTSAEGLVEKFCVARDEQVGVYGFIFFRDSAWVHVVIDDLLFTSIPKFEELSSSEKALYHHDKDAYNKSARKSGKGLLFARSGTQGETWVPLVEKAYAKVHGNFAALSGGWHGEGVEDLTGGVSTYILTKDIFDKDRFWQEELLQTNRDRLFGCSFDELDSARSGDWDIRVNGLIGGHAYSVLRAVEYKDKRFVIIRNPWGKSEWTGRWSDGSKEWTKEWLPGLEVLGHSFGDDGQFVMEYNDFLENWQDIERIRLFDDSWVMSSQWLDVTVRPFPAPWSFGDVSFTIEVPASTSSIIVLSQLDNRYYKTLDDKIEWTFDFIVYKKGDIEPVSYSAPSRYGARSVNAEVELDAGIYVVHVRMDRTIVKSDAPVPMPVPIPSPLDVPFNMTKPDDDLLNQPRYNARVLTERARSHAIAMNADKEKDAQYIPIPLSVLAGQDIGELEEKAKAAAAALQKGMEGLKKVEGDKESKKEGEKKDDAQGATDKTDEAKGVVEGKDSKEVEKEAGAKKEGDARKDETAVKTEDVKEEEKKDDKEIKCVEEEEKGGNEDKKDEEAEKKGGKEGKEQGEAEGKEEKKKGKKSKKASKKEKKKKEKKSSKKRRHESSDSSDSSSDESDSDSDSTSHASSTTLTSGPPGPQVLVNPIAGGSLGPQVMVLPGGIPLPDPAKKPDDENDKNRVTLGLRVYTRKDAPAKICGQLRHEMKINFDGLALKASI